MLATFMTRYKFAEPKQSDQRYVPSTVIIEFFFWGGGTKLKVFQK
jgi:hypothetical protein